MLTFCWGLTAEAQGWPDDQRVLIRSLATNAAEVAGRKVTDVSLLGYEGRLQWTQSEQGLAVQLPAQAPSEHAVTLRIGGI